MMQKRYLVCVVVALVTLTSLAGAFSAQAATTKAKSTIKIGIISDLTGIEATTGRNQVRSVKLAFAAIGNKINGHPVKLIVGDGQDKADVAVEVAKKMVTQDKVCVIFGPNEVGEKMAVAGYMAAQGHIPLILFSPMPMAPAMMNNPWVIGAGGTTAVMPSIMADYLANTLKYKTISTMTQDGSGGHAFIDPLVNNYKKYGGTVVNQQWTPLPCSDFAPYLTNVQGVQALVAWEAGSDGIKMLNQFYTSGKYKQVKLAAAFHGAFMDPWVFRALNKKAAAALMSTPASMEYAPDRTSKENKLFIKLAKNKKLGGWGVKPEDGSYSNGYQAALGFIKALKKNGVKTSPDAIMTAMLSTRWTGPEGLEYFAGGNHAATKTYYIVKKVKDPNPKIRFRYKLIKSYANVPPSGFSR